jgi:hypothetical protein
MNINNVSSNAVAMIIIIAAIWTIPWKGVALWKSAKNGQKGWFIALLIINTVGILEIIYVIFFSKKKEKEGINQTIR